MAANYAHRAKKAEKNNDQLFPIFERNLASDSLADFATTADKLAQWVSVDKAYYPKARPTIVHLLETAFKNVVRHNGSVRFHVTNCTDDIKPWVEPFVRLLRVVASFFPLFTEASLQERLKVLIQTICSNVDEFLREQPPLRRSAGESVTSPKIATSPAVTTVPPAQRPVVAQIPELSQASPIISQHPETVTTNPTLGAPSTRLTIKVPGRLHHSESSTSPVRTSPLVKSAVTPLPVVGHSTPIFVVSPTTATMTPQTTRPPKAKKRKTLLDDEDFIQADLNWYQKNQLVHSNTTKDQAQAQAASETSTVSLVRDPGPSSTPGSPSVQPASKPSAEVVAPALVRAPHAPQSEKQTPPVPAPSSDAERAPVSASLHQEGDNNLSKRKALDDAVELSEVVPSSHLPPHSPTLLVPSIARRRTPPAGTEETATDVVPGPSTSSLAAEPPLPSPLVVKVKKRKKKKGPPGLRFLPVPGDGQPNGDDSWLTADAPSAGLIELPPGRPTSPVSQPKVESQGADSARIRSLPRISDAPPAPPGDDARASAAPSDVAQDPGPSLRPSPRSDPPVVAAGGAPLPDSDPEPPSSMLSGDKTAVVASPEAMELDEIDQLLADSETERNEQEGALEKTLENVVMRESLSPSQPSSMPPADVVPTDRLQESREQAMVTRADPTEGHSASEATLVNGTEACSVSAVAESGPSLRVDTSPIETVSEPQEETYVEEEDPSTSPFKSKSIRLLRLARGHFSYTPAHTPVELDFELSSDELVQIARWNERRGTVGDLRTSMCVSFATYLLSQLATVSTDNSDEGVDIGQCGPPADWPRDGSIYVTMDARDDHSSPQNFSVSPPFKCTTDKSVDLGARHLRSGTNTLRMFQYRDHSDRVFAVILHHPTSGQLAELHRAREDERAWTNFLDGLGTFHLPALRLIAPQGSHAMHGRCDM